MEQALAYVCCSAEESRVKVQKYRSDSDLLHGCSEKIR
ncbi:Uncharacterised protein [[Ruminococcus] torques]|uniref:Uncharacterized protein n=1 Tax=[Ruminococcus] torques TaxID=33039 RepID=A0A174ZWI5_9FIRM|nr:Uncharacterised protein [[Ruminococcus] torques]